MFLENVNIASNFQIKSWGLFSSIYETFRTNLVLRNSSDEGIQKTKSHNSNKIRVESHIIDLKKKPFSFKERKFRDLIYEYKTKKD